MSAIRYARGASKFDAHPAILEVPDFDAFERAVLVDRARTKGQQYICAPFKVNGDGTAHRGKDEVEPRLFLALDFDHIAGADVFAEVRLWLTRFHGFGFTTASSTPDAPRCRVILELDQDVDRTDGMRLGAAIMRDIVEEFGDQVKLDPSTHRGEQPCYGPVTHSEAFRLDGDPIDVAAWLQTAPEIEPERKGSAAIEPGDDPVIVELKERGLYLRALGAGRHAIRCTWESGHTSEDDDQSTATCYMQPHHAGFVSPGFKCLHEHCLGRTGDDLLTFLGVDWREVKNAYKPDSKPVPGASGADKTSVLEVTINDFYALMPMHKFIFKPTGELWPAESINARLPQQVVNNEKIKAAVYLDRFAPVEQMTWAPCEPQLIENKLIDRGGWIEREGCHVFNLYRPPPVLDGDPTKAGIWRAHLQRIYPGDAKHIERWFAHHVQHPGDKVNHCLVLRGHQGIGKDTLLEPVKQAIGPWNWQDINPAQMLMRFNEWCKAVIVRVNEARDLGDYDRFAFYDHSKVYMAAPPDVLRVDEKNIREYCVPNVLGIIITTNHESDGIYLDADDRRHFVANSEAEKEEFTADYWTALWQWYAGGGIGHVAAYLRTLDLSGWNAKAPPPKTEAFWRIVHSNAAPEDAELANLIEELSNPQILTLSQLAGSARARQAFGIAEFLTALKTRRNVQHRLQQQGYVAVRNQDRKDGLWLVDGRRQAVYAIRKLAYRTVVETLRGRKSGSERQ